MKFFFADSHDYIDPGFDFITEQYTPDRRPQHDDQYPHEYFASPPYDGMLVSRAIVGDERWSGKYSTSQSQRFRRDEAAAYLRYNLRETGGAIMGDCGAFSYIQEEQPPYSVREMFDFYSECGFTHGVSIDHVILGYDETLDGPCLYQDCVREEWRRRYDLTLKLAEEFHEYCRVQGAPFVPIGVVQGWSPNSYAAAVKRLSEDYGYDYVALGGMASLKVEQIKNVLDAVRQTSPAVRLHIFGFTKADHLHEFAPYQIESFDSTSPMIRAFKDGTKNYYFGKRLYTAIRVPQADELRTFKSDILAGNKNAKELRRQESAAMEALRAYADRKITVESALEPVLDYGANISGVNRRAAYYETLTARPWEQCDCRACRESGIEVLIFRGSNRNRRRGFHNLQAVHRHLRSLNSFSR